MNRGAEAVESAIKAVRKWGYEVKGVPDGQAEIIVCADNFHGRQQSILAALEERTMTLERLTAKFFEPPLYSRMVGFTTVYSAVYLPTEARVDYLWPGERWSQRFDRFVEAEYTHNYGELLT